MVTIRGLTIHTFNQLKDKLKLVIDDGKTRVIDLTDDIVIDVELPQYIIVAYGEVDGFVTIINPKNYLSCLMTRNSFEYIEIK